MKLFKFVTEIYRGHFDLAEDFIEEYKEWSKFEKDLDSQGCQGTTTNLGWQYSFNNLDVAPKWLEKLKPFILEIKTETELNLTKSIWTVYYEKGGYQDAHFHQPQSNLYTVIINLFGDGELSLYDPRPLATAHGESILEKYPLKSGDWIAIPSWLIHSTAPARNDRAVLVIDIYK